MNISISTNIDKVLKNFEGLSKQYDFAIAKALTDTARQTAAALPDDVEASLDNPTPFTKRAFYWRGATKGNHVSVVGIKDIQNEYLKWQVLGGKRMPSNRANKLPTGAKLNKYGNLPRNYISRMASKAKESAKGKRVSYFYGTPRGLNRPAGLYVRTRSGGLQSLVAFKDKSFSMRKRFDFYGRARRHVLDVIDKNIKDAWEFAKRSAFR